MWTSWKTKSIDSTRLCDLQVARQAVLLLPRSLRQEVSWSSPETCPHAHLCPHSVLPSLGLRMPGRRPGALQGHPWPEWHKQPRLSRVSSELPQLGLCFTAQVERGGPAVTNAVSSSILFVPSVRNRSSDIAITRGRAWRTVKPTTTR